MHVINSSLTAEPFETRHSDHINGYMHQADFCYVVRGILGPIPLYLKLGHQSPQHWPSPAARSTETRLKNRGRRIWIGLKTPNFKNKFLYMSIFICKSHACLNFCNFKFQILKFNNNYLYISIFICISHARLIFWNLFNLYIYMIIIKLLYHNLWICKFFNTPSGLK
jgi:hypothetical protein